jgi:hypothetical protein
LEDGSCTQTVVRRTVGRCRRLPSRTGTACSAATASGSWFRTTCRSSYDRYQRLAADCEHGLTLSDQ